MKLSNDAVNAAKAKINALADSMYNKYVTEKNKHSVELVVSIFRRRLLESIDLIASGKISPTELEDPAKLWEEIGIVVKRDLDKLHANANTPEFKEKVYNSLKAKYAN